MRLRLVSGLVSSVVITGSFPGPHGPREARGFHEPSTGPLQTTRVGPARRFYDVEWDTVFRRGSLTDSLLQRPRLIAADSARLYVYDHFRHVLMAFTDSGDLLWEYGREGAGPGEFTNPADLEVAPDGTVWLNDIGNNRLSAISPEGSLRREVPLKGVRARDVVPLPDGLLLGVVTMQDRLWVSIDEDGDIDTSGPYPDEDLVAIDPFRRQSTMAQRGESMAVVFPWGNELFVYRDRQLRCAGRLVEGRPLEEAPSEKATVWVVDIAVAPGRVFTLARGETLRALRLIDAYDSEECVYLGSYELPKEVNVLEERNGVFYVESEEPYPHILGLRPVEQRE